MNDEYNCSRCGAPIRFTEEQRGKEGVCDFCRGKIIFPQINAKQMNRANELRIRREYDSARHIYENLLFEHKEDPAIWWGIFLCDYGIEYVLENDRRVITINRMQYESVFENEAYKKAIELCDKELKQCYNEEAVQIQHIQDQLQLLVQREEQYDVFISYKETDDTTSERTLDSVIAEKIYDKLTDNGYKVFFSRVSLKTEIGRNYEAKIFSALNTSPLMIVVACSREHVMADWVKNEWGRFLKMMQTNAEKYLIPVYSSVDIRDLPAQIRRFEGINAGEIGYLDYILENVERRVKGKRRNRISEEVHQLRLVAMGELLERAEKNLRNQMYQDADNLYDQILDVDITCATAWWGKLRAATYDFNHPFEYETNVLHKQYYDKAMKYADEKEKTLFKNDVSQNENKIKVYADELGKYALDEVRNCRYTNAEKMLEEVFSIYQNSSISWWAKLGVLTTNFNVDYLDPSVFEAEQYQSELEEAKNRAYELVESDDERKMYERDIEAYQLSVEKSYARKLFSEIMSDTNGFKEFFENDKSNQIDRIIEKYQRFIRTCPQSLKEEFEWKFQKYLTNREEYIAIYERFCCMEEKSKKLGAEFSELSELVNYLEGDIYEMKKQPKIGWWILAVYLGYNTYISAIEPSIMVVLYAFGLLFLLRFVFIPFCQEKQKKVRIHYRRKIYITYWWLKRKLKDARKKREQCLEVQKQFLNEMDHLYLQLSKSPMFGVLMSRFRILRSKDSYLESWRKKFE